jgi:hypothetical protein
MGATSSDAGVDEHLFLCEILELACTYDQVNCFDLAAIECVVRRLQLWEERYGEKLRGVTEGGGPAGLAEERQLFMGGSRARGRALVDPTLSRWVADRLQEESAILKERRKGREERELAASAARPPKGGKKGGGGDQ